MSKQKPVAIEPLTADQIAELKSKHGKIELIECENGHFAVVRHPKMSDLEQLVGAIRESRSASSSKPRAWDAMRLAWKQLGVTSSPGFFEVESNEVALYTEMEDFVIIPKGKRREL